MKHYALITGAGSGIGLATAELLLQNGWDILALGRSEKKLLALKNRYQDQVLTFVCDLTRSSDVENLINTLNDQNLISQIKALVNNAGAWKRISFFESDDSIWEQQLNTNILGAVRLTRELLKKSITSNVPISVVNVSSTLGIKPVAQTAAYSASKAAMISWTQTLALEVAQYKIRVNCVCPGIVDTPIHEKGSLIGLENAQPLGRVGLPKDIAKGIRYFISQDSEWVTGSILNIDGGISLL